jgi:hypothetical protein
LTPNGLRLGFAWYDVAAERLWPRMVSNISALAEEADTYYRGLQDVAACRRAGHETTGVLVYVDDGRYRGSCASPGLHWRASLCRECALVVDHLEPFLRPHEDDTPATWNAWKLWRKQWPRFGRPAFANASAG